MTLAELQRDFRGWLTDEPVNMARWIDDDAHVGLAVYHNAYRAQLVDCLRETFEKVLLWLGDEAFIDAARAHIESHPPHGWTLGVYGDGFDRTLTALYPDDPEVAELAWLDWALARAFEGRDVPPLAPQALADADWDSAALEFVPTLRIGSARTNAGAIWSALAAEAEPLSAALLPEPAAMLVWRQDFTPCFRTIETVEADALGLISGGARFAALCSALIERCGEEAGVGHAGALLGQWMGDGLIAAITYPPETP